MTKIQQIFTGVQTGVQKLGTLAMKYPKTTAVATTVAIGALANLTGNLTGLMAIESCTSGFLGLSTICERTFLGSAVDAVLDNPFATLLTTVAAVVALKLVPQMARPDITGTIEAFRSRFFPAPAEGVNLREDTTLGTTVPAEVPGNSATRGDPQSEDRPTSPTEQLKENATPSPNRKEIRRLQRSQNSPAQPPKVPGTGRKKNK